jgi:hypothetical protein
MRIFKGAGVTLIPVGSSFLDGRPPPDPPNLGSVSPFEKAMLVAKLKGARDRFEEAACDIGAPPACIHPPRKATSAPPADEHGSWPRPRPGFTWGVLTRRIAVLSLRLVSLPLDRRKVASKCD